VAVSLMRTGLGIDVASIMNLSTGSGLVVERCCNGHEDWASWRR
jgi:hypothetical protein